jgi:O-acetyl-ADP-ribose deacetylase (regulator of RNase III)
MTIQIKTGNALDVSRGLILHQTNCIGVMGAGIALQIAKKWPQVEQEYHAYCGAVKHPREILGTIQFAKVTDELWIGNLFGQIAPGHRATVYEAYPKTLREVVEEFEDFPIHIPYGIGCGLAGGNWDVVYPMLEHFLAPIKEVTIWRLENSPQPSPLALVA